MTWIAVTAGAIVASSSAWALSSDKRQHSLQNSDRFSPMQLSQRSDGGRHDVGVGADADLVQWSRICGGSKPGSPTATTNTTQVGHPGRHQWRRKPMKLMAVLCLATYPDANAGAVAVNAVAVAKQIGAALHAVAINVDIPDVSNALSTYLLDLPYKIAEAEATSRKHGKALLEAVANEASSGAVILSAQEIAAPLALMGDVAAEHSRYFDTCLVGWAPANQTARTLAEAIVFGSGRPTVLLPDSTKVEPFEHVVIAWDGSRVAARAVADARAFLERASMVTVVTVTDEKPLPGQGIGERLASGLRARGLMAEAVSIQAQDRSVATALQEHALKIGGKLLVMGGYGHSRVRDFVLGGATDGVLADLRLPVLLSH
ncbi:universal stress protein [Mesorhizobium sp. B2-4-11]|uniref:universal stress protein n=1 Tax=Mesorhizobium sp. B2-4-11 TaxID=2589938 RepID=UPI001FEE38BF|nr:universal stress protein [Mesorhizobium sp. B2-4-11]